MTDRFDSDQRISTEAGEQGKVLVLSHELSRSGAPMVLQRLIGYLLRCGYRADVITARDGPIRQELEQAGVRVCADRALGTEHWRLDGSTAGAYAFAVVNTLVLGKAVERLSDTGLPVIWWIHEGSYVFADFSRYCPEKLGENIRIFPVSDYTARFLEKRGIAHESPLRYGAERPARQSGGRDSTEKRTVLMIGALEHRKGQDLLLKAVARLPLRELWRTEFCFAGAVYDPAVLAGIKRSRRRGYPVRYLGALNHDEVMARLERCSCLVVPSRDDPLPVVAAEAFSMQIPCICSDRTGTAQLIRDGENGLVFPSEDVELLAQKLTFLLRNPSQAKQIGLAGGAIYDQYFTMEQFYARLDQAIASIRP